MNKATVVIGAGYGDEGKGLATDYFAAELGEDATVVRFNGGAQAGHTVQARDGARHIFSHFASASLTGASTFLSRYFVCHPMLFHEERRALKRFGITPRVFVDPASPVTTPYDIMINQLLEISRGSSSHGSCGIGFGETIEREESSRFHLRVSDLLNPRGLSDRLRLIRDHYTPARLERLRLPALPRDLRSDAIIERYREDALEFVEHVRLANIDEMVSASQLIFEGAQGLLLDMDRGHFPHVTRSNTGLKNVARLAHEANIQCLDVCYATRAYVSRHGAGPLPHELSSPPYAGIEDRTNIGNRWQGSLRFAWLDLDLLASTIHADRSDGGGLVTETTLLVTCLDQCDTRVRYIEDGRLCTSDVESLVQRAACRVGCGRLLASFGPTRDDVALRERWRARRSA